jgi:TolB-like protein
MKKVLVLVFALSVVSAFAQQTVVAVAPFEARTGISPSDAEVITEVYGIRLSATRSVRVVTREALDRVVREHQFQASDWSDDSKTAALGSALNADWIVRGTLQKLNNRIIVTVSVLDIKTLEVKGGADMRLNSIDDAYDQMNNLVTQTVSTMTGQTSNNAATGQTVNAATGETITYKVGGFGPANGYIFYDKGVFSNGWRYLEAAPAETEFTVPWGAYGNNVSGTSFAPGTGKRNTQLIVDYLRGIRESGKAAQLCVSLDFDGYKDWFLPSKDELNLMYVNLKQKGLGGFQGGWYWSSSQGDNYLAWVQKFSDGYQYVGFRNLSFSVRAVRAF